MRKLVQFSVWLCLGLLIAVNTQANTTQPPFKAVHVIENAESPSVAVYFILGLPAPNDQMVDGLAHYVEHLVWLSVIGNESSEVNQHSNAWTNTLSMGYWLSGSPDEVPTMLNKLMGIFSPFTVSDEFAKEERDIVLREYDYRLANNFNARVFQQLDSYLYQGNQIAATVIGTQADIAEFDIALARDYQTLTHTPENTTVIVIGDITEDRVMEALSTLPTSIDNDSSTTYDAPELALADKKLETFNFAEKNVEPRLIWRKSY